MPALYTLNRGGQTETMWGLECLAWGGIGVFAEFAMFLITLYDSMIQNNWSTVYIPENWWIIIWFANPLLYASWLITTKKISFSLAVTALLACVLFFFLDVSFTVSFKNWETPVTSLGIGYFVWTLSALLTCVHTSPLRESNQE